MGFLGLNTQHQWHTLENGSQSFREILIKPFKEKIQINNAVVKVNKENGKAIVETAYRRIHQFDKVIFACQPDQTLGILNNQQKLNKNYYRHLSIKKYGDGSYR
jgi:predicted NAD/FAD-binding protein